MMKELVALMILASVVSGDAMVYNGLNTSETQIGVLRTDGTLNSFPFKGSLTEGQPISYNGSTAFFSGQIGYLPLPDVNYTGGSSSSPEIDDDFLIWGSLFIFMALAAVTASKRKKQTDSNKKPA